MTLSIWSFVGLILGLALGVLLLAVFQKLAYPNLSIRHERAKVTGDTAISPSTVFLAVWTIALIVIPALGFLFGHALFAP